MVEEEVEVVVPQEVLTVLAQEAGAEVVQQQLFIRIHVKMSLKVSTI